MKKKLLLVLYIVIASVVLASNVYATVTTDLTLTADKTTVKSGEDVIVSINLKNISTPIASIKGYIDVDENVVNGVSEDMIVKNSDGKIEVTSGSTVVSTLAYAYAPTEPVDTDVIFNTNSSATNGHDIYFVEDFKSGTPISNDTVVMKLKLTVKSGVTDGELKDAIKLVDIEAESTTLSDGTATTDKSAKMAAELSITVDNVDHAAEEAAKKAEEERKAAEEAAKKAEEEKKAAEEAAKKKAEEEAAAKKAAEEAAKNANKNTNNTNTNTNRNTNTNNTNRNTNSDNTVSASRIPATGARSFLIPAVVLVLLGFVSYKKYMDYKDIK